MKRLSSLVIIVITALLAGCQSLSPRAKQAEPTISLPQLVQKVNANNERLTTLWTRISFDAEIRDPETNKATRVYADDGYLQYRAPGDFRIRATKTGVGLVMDVGLNPERFWLAAPSPGPDVMWWGFAHGDVVKSEIPIRPQDVLQVMAIAPIDLNAPDAPSLRFDPQNDTCILTWYGRTPGGFVVTRQIAYDRKTLQPSAVLLFEPDGHLALRARLSKHRSVDGSDAAPMVATNYELYLPANRSAMELRLRDLQISHNGAPNDASFRFPEKPLAAKEKQVDAQVPK